MDVWLLAGWTMLHFLWVGALVGVATAVLRLALRRASANVRYATMMLSLTILAAAPVAIAIVLATTTSFAPVAAKPPPLAPGSAGGPLAEMTPQFATPPELFDTAEVADINDIGDVEQFVTADNDVPADVPMDVAGGDELDELVPRQGRGLTGEGTALVETALHYADIAARYLPWLWLVGTPLAFVWLATGLVGGERLRRDSLVVDEGPLVAMGNRLAESLRIRGRVAIAVCDRVAAPVLVGIVRPLVLLPPSAITGWSPDEIEMVLLHELAHVRRWDNLVNLVQRVVEAVLFFHPAVWIVSTWVRRDRESCCDALVVARTGQPHRYAETLVTLAAGRDRFNGQALVTAYNRHPLFGRIRQILNLEDDSMQVSGKSYALVLAGLLIAATAMVVNLPALGQSEDAAPAVPASAGGEEKNNATNPDWTEPNNAGEPSGWSSDAPPAEAGTADADSPFPSLEEQKQADLAWKMLGLELEPLDDDALERVKELGYEGGLLVTDDSQARDRNQWQGRSNIGIYRGDILIGLHAWPTNNLTDVGKVLNRLDIAELSPLKFYVVRQQTDRRARGGRRGGFGGQLDPEVEWQGGRGGYGGRGGGYEGYTGDEESDAPPNDTVVTGRIMVKMRTPPPSSPFGGRATYGTPPTPSRRPTANEPSIQPPQPAPAPGPMSTTIEPTTTPDEARYGTHPNLPPSSGTFVPAEPKPRTKPEYSTKIYKLKHADPVELRDVVRRIYGRSVEIAADQPSKTLVVLGEPDSQEQVAQLIEALDVPGDPGAPNESPKSKSKEKLELELKAAQVKLNQSAEQYQRARTLSQAGQLSPLEMGKLEAEYELAKLEVEAAQLELREFGKQVASDAGESSVIRYNGRTFNQWRNQWRTELSTGKRAEAVDALAAFGAAGQAEEAADEILEVARQIDWGSNDGIVQKACLSALGATGGGSYRIPTSAWLPKLVKDFQREDSRLKPFAFGLLPSLGPSDQFAIGPLVELSRTADIDLLYWPHRGLRSIDQSGSDQRIADLVKELLNSDDSERQMVAVKVWGPRLVTLVDEPGTLLLHPDSDIQREMLRAIARHPDIRTADLQQWALKLLNDGARTDDDLVAIRVLGILGESSSKAYALLDTIMMDSDEEIPIRAAAMTALERITFGGNHEQRLREDIVRTLNKSEVPGEAEIGYRDLEQAIRTEKQAAR